MTVKAKYIDMRNKVIRELIRTRDIVRIRKLIHDRNEYRQYAKDWPAVNLDEYASKFGIVSDEFNISNNKRKITITKNGKSYAIVAAIGGKYFRIQEIRPDGSEGKYVNLDLKDPSISGEFQGSARKTEWLRLTHFRMTFKKGTV